MFSLYFGSPGCGKTTYACKLLKDMQRKTKKYGYKRFYSNFENNLSERVNLNGLGSWTFPFNSFLVIDEAGIQYNNRKFKTMDSSLIEWFKLHRHYGVDVAFISQSWDDVDITVRRLVDDIWYLKKVGPLTVVRRVHKFVRVDDESHQIVDGYKVRKLFGCLIDWLLGAPSIKIFFRFPYYKYFDTYSAPVKPIKYDYEV